MNYSYDTKCLINYAFSEKFLQCSKPRKKPIGNSLSAKWAYRALPGHCRGIAPLIPLWCAHLQCRTHMTSMSQLLLESSDGSGGVLSRLGHSSRQHQDGECNDRWPPERSGQVVRLRSLSSPEPSRESGPLLPNQQLIRLLVRPFGAWIGSGLRSLFEIFRYLQFRCITAHSSVRICASLRFAHQFLCGKSFIDY